jgi:hypothetical protein
MGGPSSSAEEKRTGLIQAGPECPYVIGRLATAILGGLAEFERTLIRTRTGEGRERAKACGSGDRRSSPRTSGARQWTGSRLEKPLRKLPARSGWIAPRCIV